MELDQFVSLVECEYLIFSSWFSGLFLKLTKKYAKQLKSKLPWSKDIHSIYIYNMGNKY